MGSHGQIVLDSDETNGALGVARQGARVRVAGYGGPVKPGVALARPVAPGYGSFGKHRAKGRIGVTGYGTAPVAFQIVRFPNS